MFHFSNNRCHGELGTDHIQVSFTIIRNYSSSCTNALDNQCTLFHFYYLNPKESLIYWLTPRRPVLVKNNELLSWAPMSWLTSGLATLSPWTGNFKFINKYKRVNRHLYDRFRVRNIGGTQSGWMKDSPVTWNSSARIRYRIMVLDDVIQTRMECAFCDGRLNPISKWTINLLSKIYNTFLGSMRWRRPDPSTSK